MYYVNFDRPAPQRIVGVPNVRCAWELILYRIYLKMKKKIFKKSLEGVFIYYLDCIPIYAHNNICAMYQRI